MSKRLRVPGTTPRWVVVAVAIGFVLTLVLVGAVVMRATAASARVAAESEAVAHQQTTQAAAKRQADKKAAEAAWTAGLVNVSRPKGRPLTVEIYGDSWTFGMDATSEANTWREIFRRALAQAGPVDMAVRAWPGARAIDMVGSITPRPGQDLSIVALGLNDAYKASPVSTFKREYSKHLEKVLAASPKTVLVCLGLWQSDRDSTYQPYDAEVQRNCKAHGGTYISLSSSFLELYTHGPAGQPSAFDDKVSDSTHPNDFGEQVIAYRVLERLPSLVPNPVAPANVTPDNPADDPQYANLP